MLRPSHSLSIVLVATLPAVFAPVWADQSAPARLKLDATLGPALYAQFRELPLRPDADPGPGAVDMGVGSLLRLELLAPACGPRAIDLLRAWLATLSARDELWVARMQLQVAEAQVHARATSPRSTFEAAAQVRQSARQREAMATATLRAHLAALLGGAGSADPRSIPRLPFIMPAELLIDSPGPGAVPGAPSAVHQQLASRMAAVDEARRVLVSSQQDLYQAKGSRADLAAARAGLASAWRDLYRASYEQLLVQAHRETLPGRPNADCSDRWNALFSDVPPSY